MTDQTQTPEVEELQPTLEDALEQASAEARGDYPEPNAEAPQPEEVPEVEVRETTERAPEPGWIDVEGVGRIRQEDLVQLVRTRDWIAQNPDVWEQVVTDYEQRATHPQQQTPEVDPDEYVDPDIAALREQFSELRSDLDARHRRDVARAVNRAASTFRQEHADVDDDLMGRMWLHIRDRNHLNTYVDEADDEYAGTKAALEDAYKVLTYDQARTEAARDVVTQMRNRRNAAAASTRERSSSRTAPVPSNPQERNDAMVAEIREALQQEATQ